MFLSLMLAAATAAAPKAGPSAQGAKTLDLVPAFVGACMNPGPDATKIRATVVKAGGTPAPQEAGKAAGDPTRLQAYLFPNGGTPYSVVFDASGTCSIVAGRVDIDVTKQSLDRLVIGSSKVFDISQAEAKPRVPGETVYVEYLLNSKNKGGGLALTLSQVTREGKGTAIFLTRRVVASK